ncbi:uncharacterized protein LAESUDRAFT_60170 [Laetiporus sulphureus 93-53]|uniref:Uncharacterized protein n=1 Tax=Laetiporus sulphureus 93-53 TaxID=1314785 RepID=A0A165AXI6_9APHY|nr:uncharacterized protein LAESUDRAFT_60170 [Laetiporus sulphureus 93-53]KZS99846.1 hypothetical protein LAESUDRAFT_60170 [Laetiporus sulphureus 93-53]
MRVRRWPNGGMGLAGTRAGSFACCRDSCTVRETNRVGEPFRREPSACEPTLPGTASPVPRIHFRSTRGCTCHSVTDKLVHWRCKTGGSCTMRREKFMRASVEVTLHSTEAVIVLVHASWMMRRCASASS